MLGTGVIHGINSVQVQRASTWYLRDWNPANEMSFTLPPVMADE